MRLEAVVLAAGAARRFGGSKLTATVQGRPLVSAALDVALAAPVETVVLVTGFHAEAVEACATAGAPEAVAQGRLRIHRTERAAEGMGASLSAGIEAVSPADGVFVFLADMPAVPVSVPTRLVAALREGVDAAAPTWRGRRGHPVLFGAALLPKLCGLSGDEGARTVLEGLGRRLALVDAPDDGVLLDIDTADDLAKAGALPHGRRPGTK